MKTTIENVMNSNASFVNFAQTVGISIEIEDNYKDVQSKGASYKCALRFDENFIKVVKQLGGEVDFDQNKFNAGDEFLATIKFEGELYEKNVRHYSGWLSDGGVVLAHWIDLSQ